LEKNELIKNYNSIIFSNDKIQTSRAFYRDVFKKAYFANTEGSFVDQESIFSGFSCSAIAKEGMNVQTGTYSNAGYGGFELVRGREDEVEGAAAKAIEMLNAPQVKGGRYNVILDNRMAGVFAHEAFGHLSEADFIYENPDFQKIMELGREFGSEEVNIADDGSIKGLAGYTPYDDEGVKASRTDLIKNGKLNARLTSRETACKLKEPLSGNARALSPYFSPIVRMTNTFIDKGNRTKEELFDMCGDGIYACGFIGGMTSLEQFTFSPKSAYVVENGKIKNPVKDAVLSGNVFETIASISGVGSDLMHFGTLGGCGKSGQRGLPVSTGGPHILLKNVLVGGR
jgi:TldD protein